jgi:hypothetical protein
MSQSLEQKAQHDHANRFHVWEERTFFVCGMPTYCNYCKKYIAPPKEKEKNGWACKVCHLRFHPKCKEALGESAICSVDS